MSSHGGSGGARAATLAAAAVLSTTALVTAVLADMPDVAAVLEDAVGALGVWAYAVVAAFVFFETVGVVGLLAPGEATLAVAGAAAAHGEIEMLPLLLVVWVAGVLGDVTGYRLGRRHGRGFVLRTGARLGVDADRLLRLESLLTRWGGLGLVGGRFIGFVRPFAPFLAGVAGMPVRRLLIFSIAGVGAWCTAFITLGYVFAHSFDSHLDVAGNVGLGLAGAAVLVWVLRRRARPDAAFATTR